MDKNFDFSALSFETIDGNVNAFPDIFLNQISITFTRKVLDVLNYPTHILFMIDAKNAVFPFVLAKAMRVRLSSFINLKKIRKAPSV